MSRTTTLFAAIGFAAISGSFAAAARADVIIQSSPTLLLSPAAVRTTVAVPTGVRVISSPAVINTTTVAPAQVITPGAQIISTPSTFYTETRTVKETTYPVLLSPEVTVGKVSNFARRLSLLRDQISMGEQRGWLQSATADDLMQKYDQISSAYLDMQGRGMSPGDNDWLETQINLLNQEVAGAMSNVTQ